MIQIGGIIFFIANSLPIGKGISIFIKRRNVEEKNRLKNLISVG